MCMGNSISGRGNPEGTLLHTTLGYVGASPEFHPLCSVGASKQQYDSDANKPQSLNFMIIL